MDMDAYVQAVFNQVKENFAGQSLDVTTVFSFIRISMETVERYKNLTGMQKKELVIAVLTVAIDSLVVDQNEQQILNFMIENFIGTLIDQFCDIDSNGISINLATKNKLKAFFSKIFPCCPCLPTPLPAPIIQAPVDPAPVVPAPVDPAPVVPAPVDPAPVVPAPVVPAPVVPAPVDPAPVTN
jgi:hypothetical protein